MLLPWGQRVKQVWICCGRIGAAELFRALTQHLSFALATQGQKKRCPRRRIKLLGSEKDWTVAVCYRFKVPPAQAGEFADNPADWKQ